MKEGYCDVCCLWVDLEQVQVHDIGCLMFPEHSQSGGRMRCPLSETMAIGIMGKNAHVRLKKESVT